MITVLIKEIIIISKLSILYFWVFQRFIKFYEMKFFENNFDFMCGQTNIYGVVSLPNHATKKLLISTIQGKVYCCEYQKNAATGIRTTIQEVPFPNISKGQIISIDCFTSQNHGIVVGITYSKDLNDSFLNIYWNVLSEEDQRWNSESFNENFYTCDLKFIPGQLTHYKIINDETVFLLLGCDKKCHVYTQSEADSKMLISERNIGDYFPELAELSDLPTYIDLKTIDNTTRCTCIGFDTGFTQIHIVDIKTETKQTYCTNKLDCPVSQVLLFSDLNYTAAKHAADFSQKLVKRELQASKWIKKYNLVVVNSRDRSVVYRDVMKFGLNNPIYLKGSNDYDVATCCDIADVDHDGQHEVVIGTYGQKMLIYNFDMSLPSGSEVDAIWSRKFAHPLIKVKFVDLVGDGINEIALISSKGLHVLQHNVMELLEKCKLRMKMLLKNQLNDNL